MKRQASPRSNALKPPSHLRTACSAALIGAVGALIAFAPAAWLARGVQAATHGHVLLADAQGSVWRGSAQLLLTGGEGTQDAASLPGRMLWQLSPSWKQGPSASMRVELPCCAAQPIELRISPSWQRVGVQVSQASIDLPAQWLSGLGAPWNTLDPRGQLTLSTQNLNIDWAAGRMSLQGTAQLDLLAMSSRLSTLSPLGDYRLQLSGGDVASINLQTLQGALQLSGSGQMVGSRIRFRGEASAAPGSEAALANVLGIIGRRQGAKSLISLG